jgi:hypothetical protein
MVQFNPARRLRRENELKANRANKILVDVKGNANPSEPPTRERFWRSLGRQISTKVRMDGK